MMTLKPSHLSHRHIQNVSSSRSKKFEQGCKMLQNDAKCRSIQLYIRNLHKCMSGRYTQMMHTHPLYLPRVYIQNVSRSCSKILWPNHVARCCNMLQDAEHVYISGICTFTYPASTRICMPEIQAIEEYKTILSISRIHIKHLIFLLKTRVNICKKESPPPRPCCRPSCTTTS